VMCNADLSITEHYQERMYNAVACRLLQGREGADAEQHGLLCATGRRRRKGARRR